MIGRQKFVDLAADANRVTSKQWIGSVADPLLVQECAIGRV